MSNTKRVLQMLKGCTLLSPSPALDSLIADFERGELVVVDTDVFREMRVDCEFLSCLESCGVDSWEGYELAQDMMSEEEND